MNFTVGGGDKSNFIMSEKKERRNMKRDQSDDWDDMSD
jgi:hypothetical protein